jgi:hypothetical protein
VRGLLIATALVLGGCATHSAASQYTRTDGVPIDTAKEQATLVQCKDEGVNGAGPIDPSNPYGVLAKEKTLLDACMARNGYIQPQQ